MNDQQHHYLIDQSCPKMPAEQKVFVNPPKSALVTCVETCPQHDVGVGSRFASVRVRSESVSYVAGSSDLDRMLMKRLKVTTTN